MIANSRGLLAAAVVAVVVPVAGCSSSGSSTSPSPQSPTHNPKLARAQALADEGKTTALELARQTTKPSAGCTRPSYFATVDVGINGRTLAADELAFFAQHASLDQAKCGALLYVFHTGQATTGSGYTAGAVIDDDHLLQVHVGGAANRPFATYDYH